MKTNQLIGITLDWAVAKAEGGEGFLFDGSVYGFTLDGKMKVLDKGHAESMSYCPSTDGRLGVKIIEREGITVGDAGSSWVAGKSWADDFFSAFVMYGPTPLVAAMRCYVASKLGEEVEIPEELLK